jgi:hypothetical protein
MTMGRPVPDAEDHRYRENFRHQPRALPFFSHDVRPVALDSNTDIVVQSAIIESLNGIRSAAGTDRRQNY